MKLVSYISARDDKPGKSDIVSDQPKPTPSQSNQAVFDRLVDYIDRSDEEGAPVRVLEELADGRQRVACGVVSCETNCFSWETAAAEMNMIASQNVRCVDPVYHFILSWRENELPSDDQIFESAKHCIEELGLGGHQYVTAIHQDTDNVHCHVAVNRVNPVSFKAANMWNDAEKLQKCCRVLERRYGFEQDNGSWEWSARDTLVPAPPRFPGAPHGAAKKQIYSDQESLYHYAVRTVRDKTDELLSTEGSSWETIHLALHAKGLGLREQGKGLVVYDFLQPDAPAIKASSVHPSMTKARLVPIFGGYEGPPAFKTADELGAHYGIFETYAPALQLRDKGARDERRIERADAREALKMRYQEYRKAWIKPDLNIPARQQKIALRYRVMKGNVRNSFPDPLLRKLMYRVAEFERMKAMAELRIQLRKERQELANIGVYRPLSYRLWVEQEALSGDQAAVSQLRGWAYREKRKESAAALGKDRVIVSGPADDSPLFDIGSHATQLRRDGTIEYLRYGRVGVVDRGGEVEIRAGFEHSDDIANHDLAVGIMSTKSGERTEIVGDPQFVDQVLQSGAHFNDLYPDSQFTVTDAAQQARAAYLERVITDNSSATHESTAGVDKSSRPDADEEYPPSWSSPN